MRAVRTAESDELFARLNGPEGRGDPYPIYGELQRIAPFLEHPDGSIVPTRYAACDQVGRDSRNFGRSDPDRFFADLALPNWRDFPALKLLNTSMATANPPVHTRLRRIVSSHFTARRVEELRLGIERLVPVLLDDLADGGDVIERVAFPLSASVMGELLGIPAADRARFKSLMGDWMLILDEFSEESFTRSNAAAASIEEYFTAFVADLRAAPGEDLMSRLVSPASDGGGTDSPDTLDTEEAVAMAALLFSGGFETTMHLLGNSLVALLEHPDQLAALRSEPDLERTAVEELLRFDSPVQVSGREVLTETELGGPGGLRVGPGDRVKIYVGAANRDPQQFPDPHRLDLRRDQGPHVSFGGGIHFCLGAPLTRLETSIALPALVRRYPDLALVGTPRRRDSLSMRGFDFLEVSVGRR